MRLTFKAHESRPPRDANWTEATYLDKFEEDEKVDLGVKPSLGARQHLDHIFHGLCMSTVEAFGWVGWTGGRRGQADQASDEMEKEGRGGRRPINLQEVFTHLQGWIEAQE